MPYPYTTIEDSARFILPEHVLYKLISIAGHVRKTVIRNSSVPKSLRFMDYALCETSGKTTNLSGLLLQQMNHAKDSI